MNDYRAAGQELHSQVLAAARKGQERVNTTVKTVRAAADQIRPQLANLPKPSLPSRAQLQTQLQTRLPKPEQLRASAEELAGHARSVRRVVIGQVASVAAPLAQQAATRLAQISEPPAKVSTAKTSTSKSSTPAKSGTGSKRSTASKPRTTAKSTPAASSGTTTKVSKVTVTSDSKPEGTAKNASSSKPKTKPADK
jgi:hypothetical protein